MTKFAPLLMLCALSGAALAQENGASENPAPARRHYLGFSVHGDSLDNGYQDWRGVRIELGNEARGRAGGHVALVSEQRFGSRDQALELGGSLPLGNGWRFAPQLALAPDASFLPRASADLNFFRELGGGWVVSAGVGHSAYRDAHVNRVTFGAERYVGAWRVAYQATSSHLSGRTGIGHDLRVARAYADASEVGLQLNAGREPTVLARGIVDSNVTGVGLFGRHAFDAHWTLWWNAGSTRQDVFYTRRGVGLGVQYRY